MAIDISIIVVSWNCYDMLRDCLNSIHKQVDPPRFEIIVVDNASEDNTPAMLADEFPRVRVIANDKNLGFAKANNIGINNSSGRYVLLLNPDAFLVDTGTLQTFTLFMDSNPDAGMCGCTLIHSDGRHQIGDAGFCPTLWTVFAHSLFLARLLPNLIKGVFLSGVNRLKDSKLQVGWICGACIFARRSCIETAGLMNEDIFMYGEDIDWGCRFTARNIPVYYLKDTKVMHIQGSTQAISQTPKTSWLDGLSDCFAEYNPRYTIIIYKVTMYTGFVLRAILYSSGYILTRNQRHKQFVRNMFYYAGHVIQYKPSSLS